MQDMVEVFHPTFVLDQDQSSSFFDIQFEHRLLKIFLQWEEKKRESNSLDKFHEQILSYSGHWLVLKQTALKLYHIFQSGIHLTQVEALK